jgi:hypothetical protein
MIVMVLNIFLPVTNIFMFLMGMVSVSKKARFSSYIFF